MNLRPVEDLSEFAGLAGDPPDFADSVAQLWESGQSRSDWCFVLEEGGERRGRVGYRVEETTSNPDWLGSLPPHELSVFGLWLPWDDEAAVAAGNRMLVDSAEALGSDVPSSVEIRLNPELHDHVDQRRRLAASSGLSLFQEKEGFWWEDDGRNLEPSDRLRFRPVTDVGLEAYRSVMARCGAGTLDRNDRYYWQGCGADNWASQMMVYLEDADADMWLLGFRDDVAVGYISVGRDEAWGATVAHVGVVPEHRGHGYIHELLTAGTAAARRQGIATMLSDVDVINRPMVAAMERAGHLPGRRPWHVWAFRGERAALVAAAP